LKYAEHILIRVEKITLPAFSGNCEFWQGGYSPVRKTDGSRVIKIFDFD
jgi:hypothetical protein